MKINLAIDRMVIEVAAGQRFDSVALKAAVERRLASLIAADGVAGISGAASKVVTSRAAASDGRRTEDRFARDLAAQIYGAIRR